MAGLQDRMQEDVQRQSYNDRRGSPYARPPRGPANNARAQPDGERWQHDRFKEQRGKRAGGRNDGARPAPSDIDVPSAKLAIKGLHYEVTEQELKDLFDRIGPTTKCYLRYDRSGRSTGMATVLYSDTRDAVRAKQEYDGTNAKGQPISIAFEPVREQGGGGNARGGADLFARLGGSSADALVRRIGGGPPSGPPPNAPKGPSSATVRPGPHRSVSDGRRGERQAPSNRGGGGAGRERGGRGGGRGGRGGGRGPAPTADSLDAELEAFMQTPSGVSESVPAPKEGDTDMQ